MCRASMYVTIIDYSSSYDIFVSTTSVQEERSVKLQLTTPTVIGHAFRHPQKVGVIKNTTPLYGGGILQFLASMCAKYTTLWMVF